MGEPHKNPLASLQALPEARYALVDLDHLVMYAVGWLKESGVDLSFESIVVASYKLFPKKFSLLGFAEYPDAKRVHKCLRRCTYKTRRWLGGKEQQGFTLNEKSALVIQRSRTLLGAEGAAVGRATSATRRKERLLVELESAAAYAKAKRGDLDSISPGDFCFMLQATLDSSGETLRANLDTLKTYASELGRQDILQLLDAIEKRFLSFLAGKQ